VLDDPAQAMEIGEAGRVAALMLNWERTAKWTLGARENVLAAGP
jgi:hypothetical protein